MRLQAATAATALPASAVGGRGRDVLNAADLDARARKSAQRRLGPRPGGLRLVPPRRPKLHVQSSDPQLLQNSPTSAPTDQFAPRIQVPRRGRRHPPGVARVGLPGGEGGQGGGWEGGDERRVWVAPDPPGHRRSGLRQAAGGTGSLPTAPPPRAGDLRCAEEAIYRGPRTAPPAPRADAGPPGGREGGGGGDEPGGSRPPTPTPLPAARARRRRRRRRATPRRASSRGQEGAAAAA